MRPSGTRAVRLIGCCALLTAFLAAPGQHVPLSGPALAFQSKLPAFAGTQFPDALEKLFDCVAAALPRLDDQTSPANVVARSVIPLCSRQHREAVTIGCRSESRDHCRAIQALLEEEGLYTHVVLRARVYHGDVAVVRQAPPSERHLSRIERRSLETGIRHTDGEPDQADAAPKTALSSN